MTLDFNVNQLKSVSLSLCIDLAINMILNNRSKKSIRNKAFHFKVCSL